MKKHDDDDAGAPHSKAVCDHHGGNGDERWHPKTGYARLLPLPATAAAENVS
ncbi:hypothetical protein ABNT96_27220 [Klebsiella pneumoniae]